MATRSIDTATIAFGLVSIPVKIYSTNEPSHETNGHARASKPTRAPRGPRDQARSTRHVELEPSLARVRFDQARGAASLAHRAAQRH